MAEKDLYKVLEIPKNASADDIKKAYKALALRYHPDGSAAKDQASENKFNEVSEAYEILGDETKKKLYDQSGYAAVRKQVAVAKPRDTFEAFFGDRNPFGAGRGPYKEAPGKQPIPSSQYNPQHPNQVPPGYPPGFGPAGYPPTQGSHKSAAPGSQSASQSAAPITQPHPAQHHHHEAPGAASSASQVAPAAGTAVIVPLSCTLEELFKGETKKT